MACMHVRTDPWFLLSSTRARDSHPCRPDQVIDSTAAVVLITHPTASPCQHCFDVSIVLMSASFWCQHRFDVSIVLTLDRQAKALPPLLHHPPSPATVTSLNDHEKHGTIMVNPQQSITTQHQQAAAAADSYNTHPGHNHHVSTLPPYPRQKKKKKNHEVPHCNHPFSWDPPGI